MENLRRCPFCGGKAELEVSRHGSKEYDYAVVSCKKCKASVRYDIDVEYSAKDMAIENWNRRYVDEISD